MLLSDWPSFIDQNTTVFWFRRDLRLKDNAGLYHALKENSNVQPVFIFDTEILNDLEDKADARVQFILQSLQIVQEELLAEGSSLLVLHGNPVALYSKFKGRAVYTNRDYEPYARQRDESINTILQSSKIPFRTYKDHLIFEPGEILKSDGTPYTVFTPYSKQWLAKLDEFTVKPYPASKYSKNFRKDTGLQLPTLKEVGFQESSLPIPPRIIPASIIRNYDKTRNVPSIEGTSRLGIHLRFGTVSIRSLAALAFKENRTWLNELIWREFFSTVLFYFPENVSRPFRREFEKVDWINDETLFAKWKQGLTGYPLVDAGIRQLNETGFMHNRVRMVAASFLTKHLLIDWRWGESYFAEKLLDYDLASNNGGWQWAAGCGCDAAPYFRIFNPILQAEKFDPKEEYIRRWIPEYGTPSYPRPVVEHRYARERALKVFQKALRN